MADTRNTFVTIAPDSTAVRAGFRPATRPTLHEIQHRLLTERPYHYTHETLCVAVRLVREGRADADADERAALQAEMFRKGQPCLRASALTKSYGYGAHYDPEGRIALYPVDSDEYRDFAADPSIQNTPAMRSRKQPTSRHAAKVFP